MGLASAIQCDHAEIGPNASFVTALNTVFLGNGKTSGLTDATRVQQALLLFASGIHDWLFDGAQITDSDWLSIRVESNGISNIEFRNIVATGSYKVPSFLSHGSSNPPAGVKLTNCSLQ